MRTTVAYGPSFTTITPTPAARLWIEAYVYQEPWQWLGPALAVEWRFADAIVEGLRDAGFDVEEVQL